MNEFDEDDDGLEDREAPDAADRDDRNDDSVDTVVCPGCRRQVYEDADLCPHCGQFILTGERAGRPWWIVVGIIGCLIVIVVLALR